MADNLRLFYSDDYVELYHGDGRGNMERWPEAVRVSDPPYNIGFRYGLYQDRLPIEDYRTLLRETMPAPSVMIHYAEAMTDYAIALGGAPTKLVAWTYNGHLARKWRAIGWFAFVPDLGLVRQPYRNPTDRRVAALIEAGSDGAKAGDWWHIEQVKNVSREKTEHPCQIPVELMERIIRVTPCSLVLDPFCGSGTTLVAARRLQRKAVGIEMDERYCEIAAQRLTKEMALV